MDLLTPGHDGIVNRSVLCIVWIISNGSINIILRLKSPEAWLRIMEMEVGFIYYFHFISVSVFFHFYIFSHNEKQGMIHLLKLYQSTWTCKKHPILKRMIFFLQDQFPNGLHLMESGDWRLMERRVEVSKQSCLSTSLILCSLGKGLLFSHSEYTTVE